MSRCRCRRWKSCAPARARRPNYDHDRLRAARRRAACLRLFSRRQLPARREQVAPRLPAGAQGSRLREPARPELRIQSRQARPARFRIAARVAGRRSRRDPGRDRFPGSQRRSPRVIRRSLILIFTLAFATSLFAAKGKLSGMVTNETTAKPSAGDTVVLLDLAEGMNESGRTQTNAKGQFSFDTDTDKPHLVRVIHQGVTYHAQAMPGETVANVEVFDVAKKVEGVSLTIDLVRAQTGNGQLVIDELFVLTNTSKPGRTLLNDNPFE